MSRRGNGGPPMSDSSSTCWQARWERRWIGIENAMRHSPFQLCGCVSRGERELKALTLCSGSVLRPRRAPDSLSGSSDPFDPYCFDCFDSEKHKKVRRRIGQVVKQCHTVITHQWAKLFPACLARPRPCMFSWRNMLHFQIPSFLTNSYSHPPR